MPGAGERFAFYFAPRLARTERSLLAHDSIGGTRESHQEALRAIRLDCGVGGGSGTGR